MLDRVSSAGGASDEAVAALTARRARIRAWWSGAATWDKEERPPFGLALSGGGIRSATFALGLLQGLARSKQDVLARVDVLSTVSGGGYIGCFLRSLFVPTGLRGIDCEPTPPDPAAVARQYRFARMALGSDANERELQEEGHDGTPARRVRNPLWWLREHSRYLAPSGGNDYGFALAYVARNWVAMVYIFMLACAAIAVPVVGLQAGIIDALPGHFHWTWPVSPLVVLLPLPMAVLVALSVAYWATQDMSTNEKQMDKQEGHLNTGVGAILIGAGVLAAFVALLALWLRHRHLAWGLRPVFGPVLGLVFPAGIGLSVAGALVAYVLARRLAPTARALLTAQLRLSLTTGLFRALLVLALLLALCLVDTLAAQLGGLSLRGLPWKKALLLPVLPILIKKLPDWLGGTGGSGVIGPLLYRFAHAIALVAGVLLFGTLACLAAAVIHHVTWHTGQPWRAPVHWSGLVAVGAVVWVLALISGKAAGFINLSSLHTLYGSRLTRAYLGASNAARLALAEDQHPHPITDNHPLDYIQPRIYGQTDLPAPIHIINTTLNETIDPRSQLVARDRKGHLLSLEPDGIRIGSRLIGWGRLTNEEGKMHVENISLGQWCAISGAAASSAMGRLTNLGYALAFTFANIRLGYWWWAPDIYDDEPAAGSADRWFSRRFGTFIYLANEMTCRYSRSYDRKYLTDGGHYENSGAHVLIRRGVPLILVSDAGADPTYQFNDLEVLVRQVRIDMGGETRILGGTELDHFVTALGATDRSIFVDPHADASWKASMLKPGSRAFVLVLSVTLGTEILNMVWIKPRLLPDLPADITGYATLMTSFPQQSTGEQFFDEAQWESYRRLGEECANRLLQACPRLLAD